MAGNSMADADADADAANEDDATADAAEAGRTSDDGYQSRAKQICCRSRSSAVDDDVLQVDMAASKSANSKSYRL
jgi:hypothetical protein